jgi:hypothetical protein
MIRDRELPTSEQVILLHEFSYMPLKLWLNML